MNRDRLTEVDPVYVLVVGVTVVLVIVMVFLLF